MFAKNCHHQRSNQEKGIQGGVDLSPVKVYKCWDVAVEIVAFPAFRCIINISFDSIKELYTCILSAHTLYLHK